VSFNLYILFYFCLFSLKYLFCKYIMLFLFFTLENKTGFCRYNLVDKNILLYIYNYVIQTPTSTLVHFNCGIIVVSSNNKKSSANDRER